MWNGLNDARNVTENPRQAILFTHTEGRAHDATKRPYYYFSWYRKQWLWMTLNVMTVSLRYFSEFGSVGLLGLIMLKLHLDSCGQNNLVFGRIWFMLADARFSTWLIFPKLHNPSSWSRNAVKRCECDIFSFHLPRVVTLSYCAQSNTIITHDNGLKIVRLFINSSAVLFKFALSTPNSP